MADLSGRQLEIYSAKTSIVLAGLQPDRCQKVDQHCFQPAQPLPTQAHQQQEGASPQDTQGTSNKSNSIYARVQNF